MGRSRRKYKKSHAKVRVGLPKKKPGVFKPAFTVPDKLLSEGEAEREWDSEGSVIRNYRAFGVVSNPNFLGVRSRTPHSLQSPDLQLPLQSPPQPLGEFDPIDSGSDLESDGFWLILGDGLEGYVEMMKRNTKQYLDACLLLVPLPYAPRVKG